MDDDSGSPPTTNARDRDVYFRVNTGWGRGAPRAEHAPELASACVAQNGSRAAREYGGHPPSGFAEPSVSDSENLAMNAVKAARRNTA
jgi:hypothetical protein